MRIQCMQTAILAAGLLLTGTARAAESDIVADYRSLTVDNLPHIQLVIQEAIDNSTSSQMNVHKMRKKLRLSYWLPTMTVRYGQQDYMQSNYGVVDEEESRTYPDSPSSDYDATTQVSAKTSETTEWQPYWAVYAEWDLSGLIFSREETYARYTKEQQAYYQQRLVKKVIQLYTELKSLLEQRGSQEDLGLEIDISAAAVKLDFLTGDYLSAVTPVYTEEPDPETEAAVDSKETVQQIMESLNGPDGKVFTVQVEK
ncbi:MAG: hypothetical protein AB7E95_05955 [Kiritimatiellales bacterium]